MMDAVSASQVEVDATVVSVKTCIMATQGSSATVSIYFIEIILQFFGLTEKRDKKLQATSQLVVEHGC